MAKGHGWFFTLARGMTSSYDSSERDHRSGTEALVHYSPRLTPAEFSLRWCFRLAAASLPMLVCPQILASFLGGQHELVGLVSLVCWPVGVVAAVALLPSMYLQGYIRGKVRRRARESRLEICLVCRYDLQQLPQHGQCPECGTEYSKELVRLAWRQF